MAIEDPSTGTLAQCRQVLTEEICRHAAGARAKALHRVRVGHAVECGRVLAQLKNLLKHGEWDRWIAEHCALSRSTASRYMRLANRSGQLTPYMTLREAYIAAGVIRHKPRAVP